MKRYQKFFLSLVGMILFSILFTLPLYAQESNSNADPNALPDEYGAWIDSIPEDVAKLLPKELFSNDSAEVGQAANELSSFSFLLKTLLELVGARIGSCVKILATVCGLLLISSVCNALHSSFKSDGLQRAFGFASNLVITLTLLSQSYFSIERVTSYFSSIGDMTASLLPLSAALYAMGGNTATAVASTAGLSVYMTVMEQIVCKSILPFCGICMAFALMNAADSSLRMGGLLSTVKKNYTTALTFLMMLLLAMLSAQSILGARSDSLAMRSVKFAAGNWIPVVGGSVAELFRSIGAGIGYLRSAVGISGIFLVLLVLLPTLVELFLIRLTWQLSASGADLLGCEREKKLLEEFASLSGYLIAAVSICSSVLMLALILLACCGSAIG